MARLVNLRSRMAHAVMGLALRLFPRQKDNWRGAMRAEFDSLEGDPGAALDWAFGCAWAGARVRLTQPGCAYAAAATSLIAALILLDWHTDRPARSIAAVMLASASLGYLRPSKAAATSLLMGGCLLGAHAASNFTGWMWPFYQYKPLGALDWLIIASVAVPAAAASFAGARLGRTRGQGR